MEAIYNYLVTIKIPAPKREGKEVGPCPVSNFCTDMYGDHHTVLARGKNVEEVEKMFEGRHVTRIEMVAKVYEV